MQLTVTDVTKVIHGATVLDHVSMSLVGGRIYGLRGTNGSGKTMLMRAMCGLIRPTRGEVRVDDQVVGKDVSFPPRVGVFLETPAFLNQYTGLKNLELLAMIRRAIDEADIRDILVEVGLDPDDRRTFRKFSLGMKQRLGIAAALMERPDLIILDEPGNALDRAGVLQVRDILRRRRRDGALIVLASHDQAEMELLADEIFEIDRGRIGSHYEVGVRV